MRRLAPWALLLVVVGASLAVATADQGAPRSNRERVNAIAATVQCPDCRGQSVADSASVASSNIRSEITRRVEAGETDEEIRATLADTFGDQILLNPPRSGFASLVWVIPVVVFVAAVAALALSFRRWRTRW